MTHTGVPRTSLCPRHRSKGHCSIHIVDLLGGDSSSKHTRAPAMPFPGVTCPCNERSQEGSAPVVSPACAHALCHRPAFSDSEGGHHSLAVQHHVPQSPAGPLLSQFSATPCRVPAPGSSMSLWVSCPARPSCPCQAHVGCCNTTFLPPKLCGGRAWGACGPQHLSGT